MSRLGRVRDNLRRAYESGRDSVRAAREARPDDTTDDLAVPPPTPVVAVHPSTTSGDDAEVPHALRIGAAWSWRLIVVGVVGWALLQLVSTIRIVVIPLAIALLLSALLAPAVGWLLRARLPRSLATFLVLVGGLAAVGGTLTLVVTQFIEGVPDLSRNATDGVRQIQEWARTGPLHLSDAQVDNAINALQDWVNDNTDRLTQTTVTGVTVVAEIVTGAVLVLFATFFFLRDGRKIWRFLVRLFPVNARWHLADAGDASWETLGNYVRATVLVAFIDAVGIGLALVILDVPFAFPLAALVFLGAFIPIVGATLSGTVAVLVALVDKGWLVALIVLGAVILVQQLEGHILQPLIMGRAVAIHPLVVIIGIAAGAILAGIVGALVAVPLVAVLNTGIRRLSRRRPEIPPDAVVIAGTPPTPADPNLR
ncbi:AI-2E family transporter [Spirilliplanes yamanashiensis]|uniref:AI-2E family transporter n=1 Tax=Spirilliplanes yamanashiensis TaxID=42233 RepID=A0A8J3Y666_9ACTN|nr:AI-2E family transporter [Spirilliplanes yamanashiensis]MDP9814473.1 putative PurR-regulated permease PerM [Spirilliplanes yamanashiensis]GIJ02124.1 AI-2E family transporter [Spirilliplanes yamanashiensis]